MRFLHAFVLALACTAALPAIAVKSCEVNGQHVHPDNGNVVLDDEVFEDGSRKACGK